MDAFDADVLIYAAAPDHELGRRIRPLFRHDVRLDSDADSVVIAGVGSVLLVPELLTKPTREMAEAELIELAALLGRLTLLPVDMATASLATALGASYRLRAVDAVHLATAVLAGADRFLTNNAKDFPKSISEIEIVYPLDLPDPGGRRG